MTPVKPDRALEALDTLDKGLHYIKNALNEPDEIITLNIPSFRADIDAACRLIREHSAEIKAALQADTLEDLFGKLKQERRGVTLYWDVQKEHWTAQIDSDDLPRLMDGNGPTPTTAIEAALGGKHE